MNTWNEMNKVNAMPCHLSNICKNVNNRSNKVITNNHNRIIL